jgi:hypothetical protein
MNESRGHFPSEYGETKDTVSQLHDIFKNLEKNPEKFAAWKYALIDMRQYREKEEKFTQLKEESNTKNVFGSVIAMWDAHADLELKNNYIADARECDPLYDAAYGGLAKIASVMEVADLRQIEEYVKSR